MNSARIGLGPNETQAFIPVRPEDFSCAACSALARKRGVYVGMEVPLRAGTTGTVARIGHEGTVLRSDVMLTVERGHETLLVPLRCIGGVR